MLTTPTTGNLKKFFFRDNYKELKEKLYDIDIMLKRKNVLKILDQYDNNLNIKNALLNLIFKNVSDYKILKLIESDFTRLEDNKVSLGDYLGEIAEKLDLFKDDEIILDIIYDYNNEMGDILWYHIISSTVVYFYLKSEVFEDYYRL